MKRDDMNIDEILKKYLPRASQEEIDAAGETVLKRIREMRFQHERSDAEQAKNTPDAGWLQDFHVGVLMAVDELQGYGRPVGITLKMQEILGDPVVSGTAVFLNLRLIERMDLVSSSPIDPEKPGELDRRYYALTELGRETLREALALRQRAAERVRRPLKGFA
jgi:hypothetical protein